MANKNFLKFILNEEITVGGKPLDDDKDNPPADYTADTPDDDKDKKTSGDTADAKTPPADNTADTTGTDTDEPAPDYTTDKPEEEPTETDTPPEDNAKAGTDEPAAEPETDNPEAGSDDAPNYNDDEPEPTTAEPDKTDTEPNYNEDEPAAAGSGEEGGSENSEEGNGEDNADNPDYTGDSPEGSDDGTGAEDTGDGTAAATPLDDDITKSQADVFSNLSPVQISIKVKELKTQYVTLFSDIDGILERLSQITRKEDNIPTLQFLNKKFLELKDMIKDSLVYTFDDKSYVQNQVTLQEFLVVYVNLVRIIEELAKAKDKK